MNEMKPEDVVISCDRAKPSDERFALREYRRRIYEAVNYRGTDDHEDVTTILLEYKKVLLREKAAEIRRLQPVLCEECRHLQKVKGRVVYGTCQATGLTFAAFGVAGLDAKSFFCAYGERGK